MINHDAQNGTATTLAAANGEAGLSETRLRPVPDQDALDEGPVNDWPPAEAPSHKRPRRRAGGHGLHSDTRWQIVTDVLKEWMRLCSDASAAVNWNALGTYCQKRRPAARGRYNAVRQLLTIQLHRRSNRGQSALTAQTLTRMTHDLLDEFCKEITNGVCDALDDHARSRPLFGHLRLARGQEVCLITLRTIPGVPFIAVYESHNGEPRVRGLYEVEKRSREKPRRKKAFRHNTKHHRHRKNRFLRH